MGRKAREIEINQQTMEHLLEIGNSRNLPAGLVQRANIILKCVKGESINNIAQSLDISRTNVIRWKYRFIESGLDGLEDNARSGRPVNCPATF